MTTINSIDEALRAIWNPRINILLLNLENSRPGRLEELLYYGEEDFPYHLFELNLITRIQDRFLSYPLLELNNLKPEESNVLLEKAIWAEINKGYSVHYKLHGAVNNTYYIGEYSGLARLNSINYTLAVSKTKTLLSTQAQQNPQYYYLERELNGFRVTM